MAYRWRKNTSPELIVDSTVSPDDIRRKSYGGWYLSAAQALELGRVAGLV